MKKSTLFKMFAVFNFILLGTLLLLFKNGNFGIRKPINKNHIITQNFKIANLGDTNIYDVKNKSIVPKKDNDETLKNLSYKFFKLDSFEHSFKPYYVEPVNQELMYSSKAMLIMPNFSTEFKFKFYFDNPFIQKNSTTRTRN